MQDPLAKAQGQMALRSQATVWLAPTNRGRSLLLVVVFVLAVVAGCSSPDDATSVTPTTTAEAATSPMTVDDPCPEDDVQDRFTDDATIFMQPGATSDQIAAVATELDAIDDVTRYEYVDKEATLAEFRELFADSPEFVANVGADVLPTSFEVAAEALSEAELRAVTDDFERMAGVREIILGHLGPDDIAGTCDDRAR